jgi:D-threo-aldose 1-dehydrogenase
MYSHVSSSLAEAAVRQALDRGISFFDTAPQYGSGAAERRLGRALSDAPRDSYRISTKVGWLVDAERPTPPSIFADAEPGDVVPDFSRDGVLRSLESSLERLQMSRVDTVLVHDPSDFMHQAVEESIPTLLELRDQGVIDSVGVGMNHAAEVVELIERAELDCCLIAGRYSLLDRSAAEHLFPLCIERNIKVIVGGVLNSGILAARDLNGPYDYHEAPAEVQARTQRVRDVCESHGVPVLAAALQFPRQNAAVDRVLIGMRSPDEVDANVAAAAFDIDPAVWRSLDDANTAAS